MAIPEERSLEEFRKDPIPFFKIPFLAQRKLVGQMDLVDIFLLSTTSRRGHRVVQCSMSSMKLRMNIGDSIVLYKAPEDWFLFNIRDKRQVMSKNQYHPLKLANGIETIVKKERSWCGERKFITYWPNKTDAFKLMVEYFLNIFPRSSICLAVEPTEVDKFDYFMQMKPRIEEVLLSYSGDYHDDFVKRVLEECRHSVKRVKIDCRTTPNFDIDYNTTLPFNFESISFANAKWLTPDHFINLFLNCKRVILNNANYKNAELQPICENWIEGSDLEYLEVHGDYSPNRQTIEESVGALPGATPVTKVELYGVEPQDNRVLYCDDGEGYRIEQANGKAAVVCVGAHAGLFLTTKFEINLEDSDSDEEDEEDEEETEDEDEGEDNN
ncbi:unnamed protein product [Caenorhabditis brenneri]